MLNHLSNTLVSFERYTNVSFCFVKALFLTVSVRLLLRCFAQSV